MSGKGQLSAEMLILLAVILAVLVLVASQLMKTSEKAAEKIDSNTDKVLQKADVDAEGLKEKGASCSRDSDCKSGICSYGSCA